MRRNVAIISLAALLTLSLVLIAYAFSLTVQISAADFNSAYASGTFAYPKSIPLVSKNITSYTVNITEVPSYNASLSSAIIGVVLSDKNVSTVDTSVACIRIHLYRESGGNLKSAVWYNDGTKVDAAAYTVGTVCSLPLVITVQNHTIHVQDAGSINVTVNNYVGGAPHYLLYKSKASPDVAGTKVVTGGQLTLLLTYEDPFADINGIIDALLPLIITVAMLSATLGMLTKFAGKG